MTIEELGSIGEFVGSVAVMITLIYLATQVRQGNIASLVQSNQAINKKYSDFMKALYTDQDVFDLWWRGKHSYKELSKQDASRFQLIMYDAFGNWHEQWYQAECGVTDETQFYRVLTGIRGELRSAGVQEVWALFEKHKAFDDKYVAFVREQIKWVDSNR